MLTSRCATTLLAIALLAGCREDPVSPSRAAVVPLAAPSKAGLTLRCTKHWAAPFGGKWLVAKNWTPLGVPGPADVVCLDANGRLPYTVELNVPTTIAGLQVGGTGLAAPATLLLNSDPVAGGLGVSGGIVIMAKSTMQFDDSLPTEGMTAGYIINDGVLRLGGIFRTMIYADSVVNRGTITSSVLAPTLGIFTLSAPMGLRNSGTLDATGGLWAYLAPGGNMIMEGGAVVGRDGLWVIGDSAQPGVFDWRSGMLISPIQPSWPQVLLYDLSLSLGDSTLAGGVGLFQLSSSSLAVTGDVGPEVYLSVQTVAASSIQFQGTSGGGATIFGSVTANVQAPLTLSGPGLAVKGSMSLGPYSLFAAPVTLALDSLVNEGTLTIQDSALVTLANGKLLRNRGTLATAGTASLLLGGGTLATEPGSSHTGTVVMQAGRIEGSGSLDTVIALAGSIEPGSPVGTLSLTKLTMSPPAGLGLDLAGTAPGSFDQLLVAGQVKLAGTLTVRELAPFVAGVCGQVFPVLLDHSIAPRGAFGKFVGLTPGIGRGLRLYLPTDTIALVGYNPLPLVSKGPAALTVAEGGAAGSYSICLQHAPTADVTVTPTSLAGQLQPMTPVTFTPTSWGLPRSVSVAAVDDAIYEPPPQQDDITHVVSSTDPAYQFAGLANEPVTILDNDGSANLELTILSAAPVVASGNSFTLNLRVGNSGPDISVGSTFSLPASAGYHFVSATGVLGCTADPVTGIRCDLPSVAAGGAFFTFDVTLAADAAGSYPTTYTLTSIQPDPAPANNARLQTITVQ